MLGTEAQTCLEKNASISLGIRSTWQNPDWQSERFIPKKINLKVYTPEDVGTVKDQDWAIEYYQELVRKFPKKG